MVPSEVLRKMIWYVDDFRDVGLVRAAPAPGRFFPTTVLFFAFVFLRSRFVLPTGCQVPVKDPITGEEGNLS